METPIISNSPTCSRETPVFNESEFLLWNRGHGIFRNIHDTLVSLDFCQRSKAQFCLVPAVVAIRSRDDEGDLVSWNCACFQLVSDYGSMCAWARSHRGETVDPYVFIGPLLWPGKNKQLVGRQLSAESQSNVRFFVCSEIWHPARDHANPSTFPPQRIGADEYPYPNPPTSTLIYLVSELEWPQVELRLQQVVS